MSNYLESLINYANAPIIVWDPEFRVTRFNRASEHLTGHRSEEVVDRKLDMLFPTDSKEESLYKINRTLAGEQWESVEIPILRKDGEVRIALWNSANVYDHDGKVILATIAQGQDITRRKIVEEALRESEEKYRELVENANSIILRVDGKLNVTFLNEFGQKFFGYGDDILGKNLLGTILPMYGSDGQNFARMAEDMMRHPDNYKTITHENMRKNGDLVWVSWTNKAVFDSDGDLVEIHSVGNDITKLKQAEEEMTRAKAQAELYLDLMGHDINNMHQIALGYLELLDDLENNESMKELMARPREVLLRSARLIDNVRKLQKLHIGAYQPGPVELVRILSDVLREYEAVPGKSLTLDIRRVKSCHVMANELLYDVFSNLVSNAIKYSGSRARVTIVIEPAMENDREFYRISIEDNGPGIADSFKEKVFNRMLQGEAGAKGMGLGLYIVKSLVDSYQGRVWVEDRVPGDHTKGSKFVVLLPALDK